MNKISYKILKFLLLYLILISFINSLQIIPDSSNPILIKNPDISSSPVIIVKFSFHKDSKGLEFNQYISLVFPKNIQNELNFHEQASPKYTCSLTDGINIYEMTIDTSPNPEEGNWTFCKLTNSANTPIKSNIDLTLTITLIGIKFSKNFLRSFSLFTSTSSKQERIIIDQLAFLGNVAIYSDPKIYSPKVLEVTKSSMILGNGATELFTIYPYQTFDVLLNLKSNSFINSSDIFITFNYNNQIVSSPISVESKDLIFNDKLLVTTKALQGNLSLSSTSSNNLVILNGINEDLYPGREFQLILKGWKALDQYINTFSPLEIKVYYKNTYSLISYEKVSTKFFNISKIPILLEAEHPDGYDIFRSGVFPMRFKFNSKNEIQNPTYVLIRHTNAQLGKNRYNFVASTCDFSENTSSNIDQNFGKRPICFPLRKDFKYPDESNNPYKASGVFFRLNSIKANTDYFVTIWGSADNCGGDSLDNFNSSLSLLNTNVKFDFDLAVYNKINSNQNDEDRFTDVTILAESNRARMSNICWNTFPQLPTKFPLENEKFLPSLIPFKEATYRENVKVVDSEGNNCAKDSSTRYCALTNDLNLYKEFYNIKLINVLNTVPTGNYFNDLTNTDNNINKEYYLYGTDIISSSSYFALTFELPIMKDTKLFEYIPSPVAHDKSFKNASSANLLRTLPGRLELKLQKQWFNTGNSATTTAPGCYFSWGINEKNMETERIMKNINVPETLLDCTQNNTKNGNHNFLTSFTFTSTSNGVDCSKATPNLDLMVSNFPANDQQNSLKHYRIVSLWNSTGPGTTLGASTEKDKNGIQNYPEDNNTDINATFNFPLPTQYMNETLKNTTSKLIFGLYSSCFKWNLDNTIKSLYASIDIQLNYLYTNDPSANGYKSAVPHRAIRLVKLFPEGGIFQDITSTSGSKILSILPDNTLTEQRTMKLHYSIGENSMKVGVCLIEISGANLEITADKNSNMLVIWIGFGILLESDYEDLSASYPVAPLANKNMETLGLQSGYFMNSNDNFYVHKFMKDSNKFNDKNMDNVSQSFLGFNLMTYGFTGKTDNVEYISGGDTPLFDNNKMFNSNRSSYLFLFGSMVFINNISEGKVTTKNGNDSNNLLIPIYCPIDDSASILHRNGLPSLYMTFLTMSKYNEISSVNRIYSAKVSSGLNATINNAAAVKSDSYRSLPFTKTDLFHDNAKFKNYLFTLRWAPYNDINDNILYLYYGIIKKDNFSVVADSNCTGHILLISTDRIIIDYNTITQNGFFTADANAVTNPAFISNSSKKFYYLGNAFHKSLMFGLGKKMVTAAKTDPLLGAITETKDGKLIPRSGSIDDTKSFFSITGIKRPLVESFFLNVTYKSPFNEIAYFCNSAQFDTQQIWGNFITPISLISKNSFIIDYNPVAFTSETPNKFAAEFSYDNKNSQIIKQDTAGNMKATITLPVKVNGGFSIKFSMDNNVFTNDSICGIMTTSNNAVTNCVKESTYYTCPFLRTDIKHSICCYNVSINYDNISIVTLEVTAEEEPKGFSIPFSNKSIYSTNDKTLIWKNTQSTGLDIVSLKSATLTKFEYFHVTQENGLGKMKLTFNLPREITRNSIYSFKGELGDIFIPNVKTKCEVEVEEETGITGNIIIESCEAPGTNKDPFVIKTKNIIYKCGLNFSKILYVTLSPVKIINWKSSENSQKTFKLTMTLNNQSFTDIANNKQTFTIPSSNLKYAINKPKKESQWETLCKVNKITPLIPGENSDYQFDFDLDTSVKEITGTSPNEVTIFFPYIHYSVLSNYVFCYYNEENVKCSFTDEETLNIKFEKSLPIGSGKSISIIVSGITNPSFYSNIYFACTVNNINPLTGERTNIITGSGILKDGIKVSDSSNWGGLRIINKFTVSDSNPRNISTHQFKITIDTANGLTNLPLIFNNYPTLIITFPKEYNLGLYFNKDEFYSSFAINLFEYTIDKNNNIIKNNNKLPSKTEIKGNRIIIKLFQNMYIFDKNFYCWEINIEGLVNPSETTSHTGSKTTGSFNFLLTNNDNSQIFQTPSNLNSSAINQMFSPIDYLITMNRGLEFKFDNSKWVIDVNSMGNLNKITVKPGRFVESTFQIKPNSSSKIQPRSINISLEDKLFALSDSKYVISTGVFQPIKFFIGCPCSSISGKYISNFIMTGDPSNDFFSPLVPVEIIIQEKVESSLIEFLKPEIVPPGGSTPIYFNIMEPNFDKLDINFIANPDNKNDSTAQIKELQIPQAIINSGFDYVKKSIYYSTFIISNISVTTKQQFLPKEINNCFTWSTIIPILEINLSGSPAIIDPNTILSDGFQYYNSETDGKDSTLEKNSIKFTFLPKVNPIYIYCALVCITNDFPDDEKIKTGDFPQNYLIRYYSTLISSKSTSTDLIFKELLRGQKYKLKCIETSTQTEMKSRTSVSQEITASGSKEFVPTHPIKTQCIHYTFLEDITIDTKKILLNYCQKIFSQGNSGCIVCTDNILSMFTPGLSIPNNLNCPVAKKANVIIKSLRFLQDPSTNSTASGSNSEPNQEDVPVTLVDVKKPFTFTVCPKQNPTCPTDVTGDKIYGDFFMSFNLNTNKENIKLIQGMNNSTLNTSLTVVDSYAPSLRTKLILNLLLINKSGLVQWVATYPTPLRCNWKITEKGSIANSITLDECKDFVWCGKDYEIFYIENSGNTDPNKLRMFEEKKEYELHFVCYNNIPQPDYPSDIYTISIGIPNNPIDNQTQNQTQSDVTPSDNSTNSNSTNTNTESSGFIRFDLFNKGLLIYLILLIFI